MKNFALRILGGTMILCGIAGYCETEASNFLIRIVLGVFILVGIDLWTDYYSN